MVLTDTHTHLYLEEFKEDVDLVIKKAISNNVSRFFLPAINSKHNHSMIGLRKKYPDNIFLMSGLHPCYVYSNYLEEISVVEDILTIDKSIVAIGEIGIDLHWDKSNLDIQLKAFERQIILSNNFIASS